MKKVSLKTSEGTLVVFNNDLSGAVWFHERVQMVAINDGNHLWCLDGGKLEKTHSDHLCVVKEVNE